MTKHGISPKRSAKPRKRITMQRFNKRIQRITKLGLPVDEALIKMLEYAGTVEIVENKPEVVDDKM